MVKLQIKCSAGCHLGVLKHGHLHRTSVCLLRSNQPDKSTKCNGYVCCAPCLTESNYRAFETGNKQIISLPSPPSFSWKLHWQQWLKGCWQSVIIQQPPGLLLDYKHNIQGCFQSSLSMNEKMKGSKEETVFRTGKKHYTQRSQRRREKVDKLGYI